MGECDDCLQLLMNCIIPPCSRSRITKRNATLPKVMKPTAVFISIGRGEAAESERGWLGRYHWTMTVCAGSYGIELVHRIWDWNGFTYLMSIPYMSTVSLDVFIWDWHYIDCQQHISGISMSITKIVAPHVGLHHPDDPCMVYLPTFGSFMGQM